MIGGQHQCPVADADLLVQVVEEPPQNPVALDGDVANLGRIRAE
jgi:hypothetical protein